MHVLHRTAKTSLKVLRLYNIYCKSLRSLCWQHRAPVAMSLPRPAACRLQKGMRRPKAFPCDCIPVTAPPLYLPTTRRHTHGAQQFNIQRPARWLLRRRRRRIVSGRWRRPDQTTPAGSMQSGFSRLCHHGAAARGGYPPPLAATAAATRW